MPLPEVRGRGAPLEPGRSCWDVRRELPVSSPRCMGVPDSRDPRECAVCRRSMVVLVCGDGDIGGGGKPCKVHVFTQRRWCRCEPSTSAQKLGRQPRAPNTDLHSAPADTRGRSKG